jgi:hypothetical protein
MKTLTHCEWLMFTNGDNQYNRAWYKTVAPFAVKQDSQLIGWDFVSHHSRFCIMYLQIQTRLYSNITIRNNLSEQAIKIKIERGKLDLGSVMARRQLFIDTGASFMPDAIFTKHMFARDFMIVDNMVQFLKLRRKKYDFEQENYRKKSTKSVKKLRANQNDQVFGSSKMIEKKFPVKVVDKGYGSVENLDPISIHLIPKILMFHQ